ncbi:MAG: gamma-glutamylcyclotransferase, partial [Lachnospiraceae bacterium]
SDDYTERAYEILVKARMLMPEQDESEQDESEQDESEQDESEQDESEQDESEQDESGQNESGQDTTSQGKSGREPEERLYLAYGSNLNIQQMMYRCPDARIVGTAELPGWRLMYKGSMSGNYLTIERAMGYSVPVAVWAVSRQDEENLDYYEGFPAFYYKKRIGVTLCETYSGKNRPVKAFVYIMHEERKLGRPSDSYVRCCKEGYKAFGFDPAILDEAYKYSCRS